jgi:hypothetical protein
MKNPVTLSAVRTVIDKRQRVSCSYEGEAVQADFYLLGQAKKNRSLHHHRLVRPARVGLAAPALFADQGNESGGIDHGIPRRFRSLRHSTWDHRHADLPSMPAGSRGAKLVPQAEASGQRFFLDGDLKLAPSVAPCPRSLRASSLGQWRHP